MSDENKATSNSGVGQGLMHWVASRAGPNGTWANDRDTNHKSRWEEYYRLWRGIWAAGDKNRKSERSRLIAPALQQAIEAITSEIESAVLDRQKFFDVEDDPRDTNEVGMPANQASDVQGEQRDMQQLRKQLNYDMVNANYDLGMAEIFLNGSIFGTGIGKIDISDIEYFEVENENGQLVPKSRVKPQATLVPVLPQAFSIDTAAKRLSDALGYAHTYASPLHKIRALQNSGTFRRADIGKQQPDDSIESDEDSHSNADSANIIDYRGLVPKNLLAEYKRDVEREQSMEAGELTEEDAKDLDTSDLELGANAPEFDEDEMVEAFVVIANEQEVLKAEENPLLHKDRLFVAYRHEIVPDQFWGRGAAEKGYNSQKALDASIRARMDGLALTVHPMMAMDAGRMPRGFRFAVAPGRNIMTNGDPKEILNPINFGQIDPNIFTDNAELERMVMMSTGGMDTAAPIKANNRNETASGMSMTLGSFVKRSKRTIRNIEKEFVIPLVQQTARLYMQFDRERYPLADYSFKAISVLGTMARELEQSQFAQMINTVPENSPAFWMLMKSFYQSSSLSNREEMVPMIDSQLQQTLNPQPPQPTLADKLTMLEITEKLKTERSKQFTNLIRARAEVARVASQARLGPSEEAKNETEAILNLAKAESEEVGLQNDVYKQQVDALEAEAAASQRLLEDVIKNAEAGAVEANRGLSQPSGVEDLLRSLSGPGGA